MRINIGPDVHHIDLAAMSNVEAIDIEEQTGFTVPELAEALNRGSAKAVTVITWVAWKRKDPTLAFTDVVFPLNTVTLSMDDDAEPTENGTPKD